MNKINQEYRQSWQASYDKLNEKQKEAVDTTEGSVMVIAGPGTGKTQLLAVRIGKILLSTDINPGNILCMTYTDAGVVAMRERLSQFIGPEAYNVNIHTFHGFCNSVIGENAQYFGDLKSLQLVSDIEEVEILRELIDSFGEDHVLKRLKGNEYNDLGRLKNLFKLMKQEKWTPDFVKKCIQDYEDQISDPQTAPSSFVYQRNGPGYKIGDLKQKLITDEINKYKKLNEAVDEIANYQKLLANRERFDFQDMILWVIDKFKAHDDLLGKYQERYQYILVDEYQDTNGAQNELLFLLADFWEDPNLFIVGDDDQSIYRFQGANMNSIVDFKEKFQPLEVVLTENYRSSQIILDTARKLIQYNVDRLSAKYPSLEKTLTESRREKPDYSPEPFILAYPNAVQEEVAVIQKIMELHDQGVPFSDMAILYTKHAVVSDMVKYLTQKKIPVNVKKRVNVLYEPEVEKLLTMMEYIYLESKKPHANEDKLFEILHYSFWKLSAIDIAKVAIACRRKEAGEDEQQQLYLKWREVIADKDFLEKIGVKNPDSLVNVSAVIESWIGDLHNVTVQTLIEKILTESNMLSDILKDEDKSWKIQLINTFFDFIKDEATKTKQLKLERVIELVDIMKTDNIDLPIFRVISNKNGINFLTAYSAKGLEFEHVFILRCVDSVWEKKRGNGQNFAMPPTITASSSGSEIEDERRLFFVAMTRAKNNLYITYPTTDLKEKNYTVSQFVKEIKNTHEEIKVNEIDEESIIEYTSELMKYSQGQPVLIDHLLIEEMLTNFRISATSLNKYLRCKLAFYFENVLRVPMARSSAMGYGNAIHYSLEHFFADIEKSAPRSYGSSSLLLELFRKGMNKYRSHFTPKEFENYTTLGENQLSDYYNEYKNEWLTPRSYSIEYAIPLTEYKGVPISGKLDRINIYDDHISVTDYKTGRYDSTKLQKPKDAKPEGGDYWRQIMFYKLLLDGDKRHNWVMKSGIMDFVEKHKENNTETYKRKDFQINTEECEIVGNQLIDAYRSIKNHEFTPGCGEENCKWCNFVARNIPISLTVENEDDSL
jgi:DNA helicase II / ATP-dependent DNA helicase PcrA